MSTTQTSDALDVLSRGGLRHEIVRRLLADIFHGDLPPGSRLVVQRLANRFAVSSTPVREALVELETIGLTRLVHNRGAVVKPFGPNELREVFQVRGILEAEATRAACGRIDATILEQLGKETAALVGQGTGTEWSEQEMASDRKLHRIIAEACGNARLGDEIERYNGLVQVIREIVGNRRQAQQRAMAEHLKVIDALLAGLPEKAAVEMTRHINRTAEDVEAVLFSP